MNYVALKMLFGDRAKYLMLLCGLTFAVMLIVQQGSIFWGLMMWSQANISNLNVPIWVTDPGIAQVDEVKPIASTAVDASEASMVWNGRSPCTEVCCELASPTGNTTRSP